MDLIKIRILERCLNSDQVYSGSEVEAFGIALNEINIIVKELIDNNKVELIQSDSDGYLIKKNNFTKNHLEELRSLKPSINQVYNIDKSINKGQVKTIIEIHDSSNSGISKSLSFVPVGILIVGIMSLLIGVLSYFGCNKIAGTDIEDNKTDSIQKDDADIKSTFAKEDKRFKILILSFFPTDKMNKSKCVGNSLNIYFDVDTMISKNNDIAFKYEPDITAPKDDVEANEIRDSENADFLIYGYYSKIENSCSSMMTCFKYSLSTEYDSIISKSGADYENDLYFQNVSDNDIINGEFSSGLKSIKNWILGLSFAKAQDYQSSIKCFENVLNDGVVSEELIFQLSEAYISFGKYEKALNIIEEYYPETEYHNLISTKASIYIKLSLFNEAFKTFAGMEELSILDSLNLHTLYYNVEEWSSAIKILKN